MLDALLDTVFTAVVDKLLIGTGRAVVCALSFGQWRGENTEENEGKIYGAAGALSFVRDGQRVVTETGFSIAGVLFYVGLVAGLFAMAN